MMRHPFVARIRRDRNLTGLLRNSGIMYASGIITIALTFIQQIVTARLLGPADYGRLATVLGSSAFLLLLLDVRTWELGTKLLARPVLDNAHDESVRIINWLIVVDLFLGLLGALLLLLAADWVATDLMKAPDLVGLVRLYAISLPFKQVGSGGPLALVRLRDRFDWLSIKSVFYAGARLLLLAGPALLGFGLVGVVVGAIIAEFINMASQMLMYVLLWRKMPNTRLIDLTRPAQFAEGSRLLINLWFSATLQALQLETFVPITALLTSPAAVGILRSAYDVSNLINSLIQPISIVLSPGIIKTYELSPGSEFRRLLKQATAILSVMVIPLTLGIVFLGPLVLPRILGPAYEGVGTAAAFFAIGFGVNAVFSWLRPVVVAMKLIREQNILSLISVVISTAGLLFVAPRYGAEGSALVVGGTIAIYALVLFVVIRRRVRAAARGGNATSQPSA